MRQAVAHLKATFGVSERRACSIIKADRKSVRYRSCRPPDTALRERLRALAVERRRFGYRRLFVLLRREGEPSGKNRIYRLYREEGLTVRKRRSRRRAIGTRAPILVEARPNARWSLDFVHDQFATGRRFRILNVVDDVTRECLAASHSRLASPRSAKCEGRPGDPCAEADRPIRAGQLRHSGYAGHGCCPLRTLSSPGQGGPGGAGAESCLGGGLNERRARNACGSAWKRDPVSGVIGVE